jgi:tetratricopeptide (TPR) repeat protein
VHAGVLVLLCKPEDTPELVRGLSAEDWIALLDRASEVGLVRNVDTGYYTVHPVLPWFFHDLLLTTFPDRQEGWERAFAEVYGEYGHYLNSQFYTNTQVVINLLDAEESNMDYALRLARQYRLWKAVENILYGLNQLLTTQGRWVEWERLIAELEAEVTDKEGETLVGGEDLWRTLQAHRAEIAYYYHDFDTHQTIALRLRDYFERAGDERNQAIILHQLGMSAEERRAFEEAEAWYRQALAIEERIGDEHGQASTLHQLGNVAYSQRQFEEAEAWYRQALAIEERIGDEYGQALALHQLGMIAQERGAFEEAEAWYRQALAIRRRIGNEHGQAQTQHQLGNVAFEHGAFEEAEAWYRQALAIEERIGDEHGQASTMCQLGMIAQERGAFEEAEEWYRKSLAIRGRIGNEHGQAQTLYQLGNVAYTQHRFEEAEAWYHQALAIWERIGNEYGQASALHQLGRIAEEQGNKAEALGFYAQAEAMVAHLDDPNYLEMVRQAIQRVQGGQA